MLTIPKGDYGYSIAFTITTSDGVVFDLSSYTATFKAWRAGSPGSPVINTACTIPIPSSGICYYTPSTALETGTVGVYMAEVELTRTGVISSTIPVTLEITESA